MNAYKIISIEMYWIIYLARNNFFDKSCMIYVKAYRIISALCKNICRSINHSADNSRDIFFPGSHVVRISCNLVIGRISRSRDVRFTKSDGVKFKVTATRKLSIEGVERWSTKLSTYIYFQIKIYLYLKYAFFFFNF